jgi:hypothetical protein
MKTGRPHETTEGTEGRELQFVKLFENRSFHPEPPPAPAGEGRGEGEGKNGVSEWEPDNFSEFSVVIF